MPLVKESGYRPAGIFRNAHASTMIPSLLRKVLAVSYVRERIDTPDGDFIDLDWSAAGGEAVVVICHGLEGSAHRPYVRGMARTFNRAGFAAVGLNFRGCSGESNRVLRSYHSGATEDLRTVLDHVCGRGYRRVVLVGFSLGGNLVLKYLGEDPAGVRPEVAGAVAISSPVDLADGAATISLPGNRIYSDRFLRKLKRKYRAKAKLLPGLLDPARLDAVRTLVDFDDLYTAPVHGFRNAAEYYRRCSSRQFLGNIAVPALLLSARNDPFLGDACYPLAAAEASDRFHLEIPDHGGHVGFFVGGGTYFSEARALAFVEDLA
jgi:predicted alpha/beta-fold hydrolase